MSMTPSRRTVEAMTLGGMAIDNRTMIVRCNVCLRTRTFLTADLVKVYGANASPHRLFTTCSKCGRPTRHGYGFPHTGEMICRPKSKTVWKWQEEPWRSDENGS